MANGTDTTTGITLPCLFCGEGEASMSYCLLDRTFRCSGCDGEHSAEDIAQRLAEVNRWTKVLSWAEAMPTD